MFQWIRPKELRDQYEQSQRLFALPPPDQCVGLRSAILAEASDATGLGACDAACDAATVQVAPHVLQDAQLMDALTADVTPGAAAWIRHQVAHPIHVLPQLTQRQADLRRCSGIGEGACDATDADVLWALDLPPLKKAWPLPLLYPQWFALRWLNHQPQLLNLYHLYRIYGAPLSHFVYPLTLLFGPWWYIRTKLKWPLPLKTYFQYLRKALVELVKIRTQDLREIVFKLVTLVVYVGIYIYGVIQSFDIALMLHQTRRLLSERMSRIQTFIAQTQSAWERLGLAESTWGFRTAPPAAALAPPTSAYQLFQSARFHPFLKDILVKAYTIQGIAAIAAKGFTAVRWRPAATANQKPVLHFQWMGHPMLPSGQQRNPALLSKNLILTGPNAAGKSTYVRGILANLLMAQTFGVACARAAILTPFRTIASLMRVQDIVGTQSLFEAECRRSLELIQLAHAQPAHPMMLFLDEPMNATPPIEGAATAMALVKYLSQFHHIRLVVTTHYHVLSNLEPLYPKRFRNVRMEATLNPIQFTYQLQPGASTQSIAIEMLEKDAFPPELLKDAIEFKNKICRVEDNTTLQ